MKKILAIILSSALFASGLSGCTLEKRTQYENPAKNIFHELPADTLLLEIRNTKNLENAAEKIADALLNFSQENEILPPESQLAVTARKTMLLSQWENFEYVRLFAKIPEPLTESDATKLMESKGDEIIIRDFFNEKKICAVLEVSAKFPIIDEFLENTNNIPEFIKIEKTESGFRINLVSCSENDMNWFKNFNGEENTFIFAADNHRGKEQNQENIKNFLKKLFENETKSKDGQKLEQFFQKIMDESQKIPFTRLMQDLRKLAFVAKITETGLETGKMEQTKNKEDAEMTKEYWSASAQKQKMFIPNDVSFVFETVRNGDTVSHFERIENISSTFFLGQYIKMYTEMDILPIAVLMGIIGVGSINIYPDIQGKAQNEIFDSELENMELALEQYRAEKNQYPENLELLVKEGYLPKIPEGTIYEYKTEDQNSCYTLSFNGENGMNGIHGNCPSDNQEKGI